MNLTFLHPQELMKRTDVLFALGLVTILLVLVMPMPKWLLDFSLAISISFSIVILMTSLFIEKPLDFSSFPMVLLVATMMRLSLNLATTRLILSHGHEGIGAAGSVIKAFGNFLMGGNFVIGIIVFAILIIVNFIVITKGSGRIAEVSARFSLDAMPGKQMAIDADLSAGLIDENQARSRRKELEEETNFYGAMDGAAKFVRGDAIAGLLITFINVIGGIIIGVAQNNLTFSQAAASYTLLTVGDGLVSQVPALVVSTAAGLLVSKSGATGSADKIFFSQLSKYPGSLGMVSFLMGSLAILPGIPFIPFMLIATGFGYLAYKKSHIQEQVAEEAIVQQSEKQAEEAEESEEVSVAKALTIDQIRIEMGYALLPLINGDNGKKLTSQIKSLRNQLAASIGFVMPSVRIQDNLQLPHNTYVIYIKEVEAGRGEIMPNMFLAMDPQGRNIPMEGIETQEPTFNMPAKWIRESVKSHAEALGCTVVDANIILSTHLTELVKNYMSELFSYAETQKLLDGLDDIHKKIVTEIVPQQLSIGGIQRILQNLLAERIGIRDLPTILEGIAEGCLYTRNVTLLTEHVRSRLNRQICAQFSNESGLLTYISLSTAWEEEFLNSLVTETDGSRQLAMAPSKLQDFMAKLNRSFETQAMIGEMPVLLVSSAIRPYIRSVLERTRSLTIVLSQNEIHPKAYIKSLGQID